MKSILSGQGFPRAAWLWVTALALSCGACSHDYQLMKMEEQVSGYGSALRWNLFKRASAYLDYTAKPRSAGNLQALEKVKVTSYRPVFRDLLPSGTIALQSVEIRYIPDGGVQEKTLTDEQRWRFDENQDRWVLQTGLPKFQVP